MRVQRGPVFEEPALSIERRPPVEPCGEVAVAGLRCFTAQEPILRRSFFDGIRHLAHSHVGGEELGIALRQQHPEVGPVGVADEIDPALSKAPTEQIAERTCIGEFPLDPHRLRRDVRMEGLSGSEAVPLHYDEAPLELALEGVRQVHRGHPGPTMQKQQNGVAAVGAADEDPLAELAELDGFERGNSVSAGNRGGPAATPLRDE
jgi:hypothetical protein